MITIDMQFFGGNGASSGKSGSGTMSNKEREENMKFSEELRAGAERYERQASAIDEDAANRRKELNSLEPGSKRFRALEEDILEREERAIHLREMANDLRRQARELRNA